MSTIQRVTGLYKIISDSPNTTINRSSDDYGLIYSLDDSNIYILYSMMLDFNNENVMVKIEIDDRTVFEFSLFELNNITNQFQNSPQVVHLDRNNDAFIFKPSLPILVRRNIKIYAKATTNSVSRIFEQYHIEVSEE